MQVTNSIDGTPCAITQHALDKVKQKFFDKYQQRLTNIQALWLCGFIVDGSASLRHDEHLYRHQSCPTRVSKGIVWKGWVRNQVDVDNPVGYKGKINYTNKYHPLQSLYFYCEVVTGDVIDEATDYIMDIGEEREYVLGMSREQKELIKARNRKPRIVDMDNYEE